MKRRERDIVIAFGLTARAADPGAMPQAIARKAIRTHGLRVAEDTAAQWLRRELGPPAVVLQPTEQDVLNAIPAGGATAVQLASLTGLPLRQVRTTLRRLGGASIDLVTHDYRWPLATVWRRKAVTPSGSPPSPCPPRTD